MLLAITAALVVSIGSWLWHIPASAADAALRVADGMRITIEYTILLPDKSVAFTNVGQAPFSYVHGEHQIFPTLENALVGLKSGEKKQVALTADQAFGLYDESKKESVEKDKLPANLAVGTMLTTREGQVAKVVDISGNSVVLDLNHPLAGKNLVFDVNILKVEKEPTVK